MLVYGACAWQELQLQVGLSNQLFDNAKRESNRLRHFRLKKYELLDENVCRPGAFVFTHWWHNQKYRPILL